MILNEEGKKDFLKTKFHQTIDITLENDINNMYQFVNFVLPLEKINEEMDIILSDYKRDFFNDDYNNVIFTPYDNYNYIYKYEFYKERYFIRLQPYSKIIRMHIIPKKYNASNSQTDNNILFFKDANQKINSSVFSSTEEYTRNNRTKINSQYQETTEKPSNAFYKFDIKKYTKNMKNLQINLGYSYNETNPTNPIKNWHITGILDESDENGVKISADDFTEFNSSLVDINADRRLNKTNKIIQSKIKNNQVDWSDFYIHPNGFDNHHTINLTYHKTLKYFNDDLYIEEDGQYHIVDWIEINEE